VAYVAVLQASIEKASANQFFNVETAINDLWTSLDPVRKLSAAANTGNASTIDSDTQALQKNIQQQAELFQTIGEMLKVNIEAQKAVTQSVR
jgi:hypothetical protein